MKLKAASDSSLLVEIGSAITPLVEARVLGLFRALQELADPRIRNLHPGYVSLLVDFHPLEINHAQVAELVEAAALAPRRLTLGELAVVDIPVCYDAEFGPDQVEVADHARLSVNELIRLHSTADYYVSFLGFTGGFAYLRGMPEILSMPRLPTPRRSVAAGSIGIAGSQTGIYPTVTPGGWRLIGRSPLRMFDPHRSQPTVLLPGNRVSFVPVDRTEFERILREQG